MEIKFVCSSYFISCCPQYFRVKDALPPDMKKRKPSKVLGALSTKGEVERSKEGMETGEDEAGDPFENGGGVDRDSAGGSGGAEGVKDVDSQTVGEERVSDLRSGRIDSEGNMDCSTEGVKDRGEEIKSSMESENVGNKGGELVVTAESQETRNRENVKRDPAKEGIADGGGGSGEVRPAEPQSEEESTKAKKRGRYVNEEEEVDKTEAVLPSLPAVKRSKQTTGKYTSN